MTRYKRDEYAGEPGMDEKRILQCEQRLTNTSLLNYGEDRCVQQLFERQVEQTPDTIAVVYGDESLTYRHLNHRANQLADYLLESGVGPEVQVCVCLDRSPAFVVAILAVLKAGGAYVPLDPAYPAERLVFMLEDTGTPVLLTQERLLERVSAYRGEIFCSDRDWSRIADRRCENPGVHVSSDHLAYVIYTSGSTGKPKGVQIPHRGLLHLLYWHVQAFALTRADRATHLSGLGFDASVWELWPYLISGAQIYLVDDETRLSPLRLQRWLITNRITICFLPTPLAESVLDLQWPGEVALRVMLIGGEKLHRYAPPGLPFQLVNNYGPTENSVVSTSCPVPCERRSGTAPSIGRPIANTQAYVLDSQLRQVSAGETGELYLSGPGLARGYLYRPQLTAECFLPHPFSDEAGARLYRTGDLVRYLPDGNLEFLGRRDQQVKIRGYRIELGEIEAVLNQHPMVRACAVAVRGQNPEEKQLVAYIVARRERTVGKDELLCFLRERLPDHMVPFHFTFLEELPLTPNGKVDYSTLTSLSLQPELGTEFVAPHTPVEEMVAALWREILGIERVGVHDSFLELGGNSLAAGRIVARLCNIFPIDLTARHIFEARDVAQLAHTIELARQGPQGASLPPLRMYPRNEPLPLSFAQQRLWFIEQLTPGGAAYHIQLALHLSGQLNKGALEQSLNEIVKRHEALRTAFDTLKDAPVQIIRSQVRLTLLFSDLRSDSEAAESVRALAAREFHRPFELKRPPLLRALLLQVQDEDYILVLTMHHLIADGWSVRVLFNELEVLYRAYIKGEPALLPTLAVQPADFACWQRQWLESDIAKEQLAYWHRQLDNLPELLQLPTDRPRPAVQTFRGATRTVILAPSLTKALRAMSRQEEVTLFMLLLAAFTILLAHYSGQEDIAVGTPVANRNRVETEGMIGFFVNTLVLRTDLAGDPDAREVLRRVRSVTLDAYAYQDAPFEWVVQEIQPERDLSRNPLFQVMFALQDTQDQLLQLPGISSSPITTEQDIAQFDLSIDIAETKDELVVSAEYNTDLFDGASISRLLEHYETLLQKITTHPAQRLSTLSPVTTAELRQLLVEWNNTRTGSLETACLHQLFERQVARTPDTVAISIGTDALTYRELDEKANRLAGYLQKHGVKPEVCVGICMQRSLEMVICMLGILKAGGAYVPLDPGYPQERLAFIIEDTHMPILLAQNSLRTVLPATPVQVVWLDSAWKTLPLEGSEDVARGVDAENIAYTIYTSGSTGLPKGVAVPHRAVVNHSMAIAQTYALEPGDRVLQFAALTFDVAAEEIFPTLFNGATVVLYPEPRAEVLADFTRRAEQEKLTVLNLSAAYWHAWIDELVRTNLALPACLRLVIAGSEQVLPERLALWRQRAGESVRWLNAYGLTETAITSTLYEAPRNGAVVNPVPIGRPIANTQVYVLDRYLCPVPVGIPGELYIGGGGLARGYLNQPERTARRFIPDPFGSVPGARFYRTGDRARYLADGSLELLGRTDRQVKIRGFRIELSEVESILCQYPGVREVVVQVQEDEGGDRHLVAYVAVTDDLLEVDQLRGYLQEKLPPYMLPSAFVVLAALPRTPGGKVDYRSLPTSRVRLATPYTAPRNAVEEVLADIWAEVLKCQQVSIYDNFFALGGHSLLAIQAISRIRSALQVDVSVQLLFQSPTIAGLSEDLIRRETTPGKIAAVAQLRKQIATMSHEEIQALLHAQKEG